MIIDYGIQRLNRVFSIWANARDNLIRLLPQDNIFNYAQKIIPKVHDVLRNGSSEGEHKINTIPNLVYSFPLLLTYHIKKPELYG